MEDVKDQKTDLLDVNAVHNDINLHTYITQIETLHVLGYKS